MSLTIQIKSCAECRDMLPRPRPTGRSPGVPDKSSWSLCCMSRYSAQILICFIAYIFQFSYSPATTQRSLCHFHGNETETGYQAIESPNMPCWGAAGWKQSLTLMPQDWWNWQIKWVKALLMKSFQHKNQVNGEFFAYLCVILMYFSAESRLIQGCEN